MFLWFVFSCIAPASHSVTLAWDPNPEPDLAGYRLHYGTSSGAYTEMVDVGNQTTATVEGLPSGLIYYFAVTAYNTSNLESLPSNEVSWSSLPPDPEVSWELVGWVGITFTFSNCYRDLCYDLEQAPTPDGPWERFTAVMPDENNQIIFTHFFVPGLVNKFFRASYTYVEPPPGEPPAPPD